jgi:hypothetical protein
MIQEAPKYKDGGTFKCPLCGKSTLHIEVSEIASKMIDRGPEKNTANALMLRLKVAEIKKAIK